MNVSFFTEAGKKFGLGHLTRCISICQAFQEAGVRVQLAVNADQITEQELQRFGFENIRFLNWIREESSLRSIMENSDIVFVDSYLASPALYEKIEKCTPCGVYLDDDIRIDYPKGFVLNGAILAEKMPYPKNENVHYLLGTQYTPLRKEFWDVPEKTIRPTISDLLITLGGNDLRNLSPSIIKSLNTSNPEISKFVIVSKSFTNISEIKALEDDTTTIIDSPSAEEMKKLMLTCDLGISTCGQTLYEMAQTGLPTIGIAVADNQKYNVDGWSQAGFLRHWEQWDNKTFIETIHHQIRFFQDPAVRKEISCIGRTSIDGQGARRIVRTLLRQKP